MGKRNRRTKIANGLALVAILSMVCLPAFAQKRNNRSSSASNRPNGKTIPVQAVIVKYCQPGQAYTSDPGVGCKTDAGAWDPVSGFNLEPDPRYSILGEKTNAGRTASDDGVYESSTNVQSEILTHNTIYTLNTLDTLNSSGQVDGNSVTVTMHFYNYFGLLPPPCWGAPTTAQYDDFTAVSMDVEQAVNWSIFSDNSMAFPDMEIYDAATDGPTYPGFARLDFNVRNGDCEDNVFRFYLRWSIDSGGIRIKRLSENQWEIATNEFGEATLDGQGGRKNQTQSYGSWRVPFKIILTNPQQ